MSITDPIADALTMIRNASSSKKEKVDIPSSGLISEILGILKREGFILNFKPLDEAAKKKIRVYLRFDEDKATLTNISRISKPGLRKYAKKGELRPVLGGFGIAILSTSKGIMTDKEAREAKVGGEVVCYVW